jgi:hypothetical protein
MMTEHQLIKARREISALADRLFHESAGDDHARTILNILNHAEAVATGIWEARRRDRLAAEEAARGEYVGRLRRDPAGSRVFRCVSCSASSNVGPCVSCKPSRES